MLPRRADHQRVTPENTTGAVTDKSATPPIASDKGKTPLAPPEVLAEKTPPAHHLITASTTVWGDNLPLADLLRDMQKNNEVVIA